MMSQKEPFSKAFTVYPNLRFEAFLVFNIEAFQLRENKWFENSYSLNLYLSSDFIRENVVHYLSGFVVSNPNEETFNIDNDRWNMSTVVEAKLLNDEIQSMLYMGEIDEYSLHFLTILTWSTDVKMRYFVL
jgi:hypothetical protein